MFTRCSPYARFGAAAFLLALLVGCAERGAPPRMEWEGHAAFETAEAQFHLVNRITWGATPGALRQLEALGTARYLEAQLKPAPAALPAAIQAQIGAMTITARPLESILFDVEQQRRAALSIADPESRKAAQRAYQQELTRLGREAATRSLLRAIHSPNQLEEQMTWFWMNHFNVFQFKGNVRAMVGDYEENAIRPHALGRFRALLGATAKHPAMLRYLDNVQNGASRLNENYARELMELHTLGADAGYTQQDVQELARILTGVGIAFTPAAPSVRAARQADHVRAGAFEFNPNRHDYGDKRFLGGTVKGAGLNELEEVLDQLARHPATARFVSRKLAVYFVSDDPPAQLVERLARTFQSTDGDIAATLRVLFATPEFARSMGRKFKDPVHYVVSGLRLASEQQPVVNVAPALAWLNRMGQGLYSRQTPDGYPLTESAWTSPGQMTTRFEIATAMGSFRPELFADAASARPDGMDLPQLSRIAYEPTVQKTLHPRTRDALSQARSAAEWNVYFLSSPEFMRR